MKKKISALLLCFMMVFGSVATSFAGSGCEECDRLNGDSGSTSATEDTSAPDDVKVLEKKISDKAQELRVLAEKNKVLGKYGPLAEDAATSVMLAGGDIAELNKILSNLENKIAEVKKLGKTNEEKLSAKPAEPKTAEEAKIFLREQLDRAEPITKEQCKSGFEDMESLKYQADVLSFTSEDADEIMKMANDLKAALDKIVFKDPVSPEPKPEPGDDPIPKPDPEDKPIPNPGVPNEYDFIYKTDKVILSGVRVEDISEATINKSLRFEFYNTTTQRPEAVATTKNGVLSDVELIKDHHYLVRLVDKDYELLANTYFHWNSIVNMPINDKDGGTPVKTIYVHKRAKAVEDPAKANRVHILMQIRHCNVAGGGYDDDYDFGDTKIKFTSQNEVIEVPVTGETIEVDLIEDVNYMVSTDDRYEGFFIINYMDGFLVKSFPVVVKDHSERPENPPKMAYTHLTCGNIAELALVDKGAYALSEAKPFVSKSNKTTVTGFNFLNGNYILHDRVRNDVKVPELEGKEYDVIDIDAINLYRNEISKLAEGTFNILTQVKPDKHVKNVYYIDEKGKLQKLNFKQNGDKVKFTMNSLSLYDNVIEYGEKEDKPSVTPAEPEDPNVEPEKPDVDPSKPNVEPEKPDVNPLKPDANNADISNGSYMVTEGNGLVWKSGSKDNLKFRFAYSKDSDSTNYAFENFTGIKVDGKLLVRDVDYTATKGSVIVNLKAEYLNKLKSGDHIVTAMFKDGKEVNAGFKIENTSAKADGGAIIAKTGDTNVLTAYVITLLIAISILAAMELHRRKILNK